MFKVENLEFSYKGKEQIIKGISFEVKKGEIFGLLGPSGAGKSTTQKILIKLLQDFRGKVLYKAKDLNSYSNNYYEEIGVGFEMPIHFNKLTATENLNYFKNLYKKTIDIDELLKKVGLYEDKDKLVSNYSKGMKMRLNFVRAMINNPDVLFLDEVTNGLDPRNSKILKDLILEYKNRGGTVFLTTHLMNDVEDLCDRVAFLKKGKIIEISTVRELKLKYGKRVITTEEKTPKGTKKQVFDIDRVANNKEFIDILNRGNLETIHSGETTLEEIFIKVTGDDCE